MLDSKIEAFVRSRAGDTKHSGRTFYEHLVGTYNLLKRDGAANYVCLAGLFHSIYGTNAFQHSAVLRTERDLVAGLIGKKAEWLAYVFCSCNRPRALVEAVEGGAPYHVNHRLGHGVIGLSPTDLADLLEIEVANLMDQGAAKSLPRVVSALYEIKGDVDA